jgi:hypothetical protein
VTPPEFIEARDLGDEDPLDSMAEVCLVAWRRAKNARSEDADENLIKCLEELPVPEAKP